MPIDTPLHKAAHKGDVASLEAFLEQYPQMVDARGAQNRTALHRAVGSGSPSESMVATLLHYKANPTLADAGGLTPLHWAASFGNVPAAKLLISAGGDVNAVTNAGETPLHIAAEKGHTLFVLLLLEHGADKSVVSHNDGGPDGGKTAFDLAKRGGHMECMQELRLPSQSCCVIM